jgi:hypothetical protein
MKRIWVPIDQWEEIRFNMWGEPVNRRRQLEQAVIFTGNHRLYGRYMQRVIREWPNSCRNALTDLSLNRRAWIGHAACALALRCPEDITRQAWGLLSNEQRQMANRQADRAIHTWEVRNVQGGRVREPVEKPLLWQRDTRRGAAQGHAVGPGSIVASGCSLPAP